MWQFATAGLSLHDYFHDDNDNPHQRMTVTSGGDIFSVDNGLTVDVADGTSDPIFGASGDLAFNWWHANNGCRIAIDGGHLSEANVNDDDTHGLGNEYGADTNSGGQAVNVGSTSWWHDASVPQPDCHGGSCVQQGTDRGTSLADGPMLGQYAIYVSDDATSFECGSILLT